MISCSPFRVHTGLFFEVVLLLLPETKFSLVYFCCFLIKLFSFNTCSLHTVLRNNTQRYHIPFPVSPMLTSCKTVVQYLNQDIHINTVKIQDSSVSFSFFLYSHLPLSPSLPAFVLDPRNH